MEIKRRQFKDSELEQAGYNPLAEINKYRFAKTDKEVVDLCKRFYEKDAEGVLDSTERAQMVVKLLAAGKFFVWIVGDILLREKEKIQKENEAFKDGKTTVKPQFSSLHDWYCTYEDHFDFKEQTMYNYINLRLELTPEVLFQVGVDKGLEIAKLRNEDKEEAIKAASQMSTREFKVWIKEQRKEISFQREDNKTESLRDHPITILQRTPEKPVQMNKVLSILENDKLDEEKKLEKLATALPVRIRENERLLSFKSKAEAERFDLAFNKYERKIKQEMDKLAQET
jgi:hypothetical protein